MLVQKRMQPMIKPTLLQTKSWDNLPLLTLELSVDRNEKNERHHKVLKRANYWKVTLLAAYNMQIPNENDYIYTAASKTLLSNETVESIVFRLFMLHMVTFLQVQVWIFIYFCRTRVLLLLTKGIECQNGSIFLVSTQNGKASELVTIYLQEERRNLFATWNL